MSGEKSGYKLGPKSLKQEWAWARPDYLYECSSPGLDFRSGTLGK